MKARLWIAGASLLLMLLVASLRFIPGVATFFTQPTDIAAYTKVMLTYLALYFAIVTATISGFFLKEGHTAEALQRKTLDQIAGHIVRPQRDDEFYEEFLAAAKHSQHSVYISYFAAHPPHDIPDSERIAYYAKMADLMRSRHQVRFRRLVRRADENIEWVRDLAAQVNGCSNVDIALLKDAPDKDSDSLALSVQIVDSKKAWVVALAGHERSGQFRDLYVEGEVFATNLALYYDRLWRRSEIVFQSGRLTTIGEKTLGVVRS